MLVVWLALCDALELTVTLLLPVGVGMSVLVLVDVGSFDCD